MPNTQPVLHVRIISPHQVMLDTEAESVSSENVQGKFDILPFHANFISLVENKPIIVRKAGQKKPIIFAFTMAIIVALDNKVDIYTYITQPQ